MMKVTLNEWMRWAVYQIVDGTKTPIAAFHMLSDAELFAVTLRDYGVMTEIVDEDQARIAKVVA